MGAARVEAAGRVDLRNFRVARPSAGGCLFGGAGLGRGARQGVAGARQTPEAPRIGVKEARDGVSQFGPPMSIAERVGLRPLTEDRGLSVPLSS